MKSSISIQASSSHSNCAVEFRIIDRSACHPVHLVKMLMKRTKRKIQWIFRKSLEIQVYLASLPCDIVFPPEIMKYLKSTSNSLVGHCNLFKPFDLYNSNVSYNKQTIHLPSFFLNISVRQPKASFSLFLLKMNLVITAMNYIYTF